MNCIWRVKTTVTAYPNGCIYMQGSYLDAMGTVPLGQHIGLSLELPDAMSALAEVVSEYVEAARGEQLAFDLRSIVDPPLEEGR